MDVDGFLWAGGLFLSLPLLAVKVGIGLERGRINRRQILLTYGMYLALSIGVTGWMSLLSGPVSRIVKGGPFLHCLVGVTMIAWGALAIRCFSPKGKRSRAQKVVQLLTLPCPAYLIGMIVSLKLAGKCTRLPAPAVGAALGTAFVSLAWMSQLLSRAARGRTLAQTSHAALALALFVMGTYFLAATFLAGAMRDAGQVYASFIADGAEAGTGHGPWVWLMLAAIAALGYFARGKSETRL